MPVSDEDFIERDLQNLHVKHLKYLFGQAPDRGGAYYRDVMSWEQFLEHEARLSPTSDGPEAQSGTGSPKD